MARNGKTSKAAQNSPEVELQENNLEVNNGIENEGTQESDAAETEEKVEGAIEDALKEIENLEPANDGEVPTEAIDEAQELANANQELEESQDKLEQKLESDPENAEQIIKDEIAKVEKIKNNVEKVAKKYSNMQISNSWNGMVQDW